MRDIILIKNAKCYKCYFLAFETQKTHSIKTCICYKICNLAIVHSHFWERTIARLYNILLIYLFSLQLSISLSLTSLSFLISLVLSSSPTSLSFPHSLSLSHFLTPSHNKIVRLRSAWWRGEWRDGVRSVWRRSTWRPMWRSVCYVFSCGCCGWCLVVVFCGSCA